MSKGFYQMPYPVNEEVRSYEPNSKELESLINKYEEMYHQNPIHIPLYIGNDEIITQKKLPINPRKFKIFLYRFIFSNIVLLQPISKIIKNFVFYCLR